VILCCTDGLWSGVGDADIARSMPASVDLRESVQKLAEKAVAANGPASDNTTVAALRWLGP